MAEPVTPAQRKRVARPIAWDATLSLALVAMATLTLVAVLGGFALAASSGEGRWAAVLIVSACALVGLLVARSLPSWPSVRAHSRVWLVLSTGLGILVVRQAGMLLGPWPDLLSDEVIAGGPIRFYFEAGKSLLPWAA